MFINEPLTNYDITKLARELKIKNFRGVFMRDTLPDKVNKVECGIVNLDVSQGSYIYLFTGICTGFSASNLIVFKTFEFSFNNIPKISL